MPNGDTPVTIEGFVTDDAFVDRTKTINDILHQSAGKVASLTQNALSYFIDPNAFKDNRAATARSVNWVADTSPQLILDQEVFGTFVQMINALGASPATGFFKIIDRLFFKYNQATAHSAIETQLLADTDIAAIYVPDSFSLSTTTVNSTVYLGNTTQVITVPAYINFSIKIGTGPGATTFVLRLYTSVDAWATGYNTCTIIKVVPPLPYNRLYTANLVSSTDNVFSTASTTASLAYSLTHDLLDDKTISGMVEYIVALTDGTNRTTVPFNLIYKGRPPTTFEIRNAIKNELLTSGVGDEAGWYARVPGVFVSGRFYVIPFWNSTYTKPDQVIFPNLVSYTDYGTITNQILASLGYGDASQYIEILQAYYNHMSATVVPDLSGVVELADLKDIIPDYQSYSTTSDQFGYMDPATQGFARDLNAVLAVEDGSTTSLQYTIQTEGALSFYTFTVGNYEICVVTKQCYDLILESTQ